MYDSLTEEWEKQDFRRNLITCGVSLLSVMAVIAYLKQDSAGTPEQAEPIAMQASVGPRP